MNPSAHIAAVATLLFIFGFLALGVLFDKPRNTRRGGLRKWLRVNGILK